MRYCPECGTEYRPGYETCSDCQVALVDEPPGREGALSEGPASGPVYQERVPVFRTGRRMDAELVRGRLEADGLQAWIWSSGLGAYRMESALTEVTGVPNDFNAHHVVVDPADVERALEVLGERVDHPVLDPDPDISFEPTGMSWLRQRWLLLGFALFLLLAVILLGGPGR